jgi:hypothetical protein
MNKARRESTTAACIPAMHSATDCELLRTNHGPRATPKEFQIENNMHPLPVLSVNTKQEYVKHSSNPERQSKQ